MHTSRDDTGTTKTRTITTTRPKSCLRTTLPRAGRSSLCATNAPVSFPSGDTTTKTEPKGTIRAQQPGQTSTESRPGPGRHLAVDGQYSGGAFPGPCRVRVAYRGHGAHP